VWGWSRVVEFVVGVEWWNGVVDLGSGAVEWLIWSRVVMWWSCRVGVELWSDAVVEFWSWCGCVELA
jgi:hypothetical protein